MRCRRCKAQSSRTKLQCAKSALQGKTVCVHHGGYSADLRSKEDKNRIRDAHLKNDEEILEVKAERSIGSYCNMFFKELKPQGRPP